MTILAEKNGYKNRLFALLKIFYPQKKSEKICVIDMSILHEIFFLRYFSPKQHVDIKFWNSEMRILSRKDNQKKNWKDVQVLLDTIKDPCKFEELRLRIGAHTNWVHTWYGKTLGGH